MVDEFKIRSQVAEIEATPQPPIRKARLMLRIARRIRAAARHLALLSRRSFREGDLLRAARMHEATERLMRTQEEVRSQAGKVLADEDERPKATLR